MLPLIPPTNPPASGSPRRVDLGGSSLQEVIDHLKQQYPHETTCPWCGRRSKRGRPRLEARNQNIFELREAGEAWESIAQQYNMKAPTAREAYRRRCARLGIKPKHFYSASHQRKNPNTDKIKDARTACFTLQEIGDVYGITRERVRQICSDLPKEEWPHKELDLLIIDLRENKRMTFAEIGNQVLISGYWVRDRYYQTCKQLGKKPIRRLGGQNSERDRAIKEAWLAGKSQMQLAKEHETSQTNISRICRKLKGGPGA